MNINQASKITGISKKALRFIRKNQLLRNIIFEIFSIEPEVASEPEEVATGVALYSLNQLSKSRN